MKNFSKLFLASLLAGSLIMTGCGGENPTSSSNGSNGDGSQTPTAKDETPNSYAVAGKVSSTTGAFNSKASIKITLTNIATQKHYDNDCVGQMFAFEKIDAGYYQVKAEDGNGVYAPETLYQKVESDIDNISITLTAKNTQSEEQKFVVLNGKLIDETGNDIPFATISAKNVKTSQEIKTSTGFDNGNYTLNIPVGNYKVTYTKDSFDALEDINLIITDENTITFNEKKVTGNSLSNITLTYKLMKTGSIAGVLTNYSSGSKCLLYKTTEGASSNPGVVLTFTAKENGYFFIKNLQPGWYSVTKEGASFTGKAVGQGYEYVINNPTDQYFSWMEVVTDTTTPVPSAEQ